MESKKINQLATELAPDLSDLTIIGDPTTGISKKITLSQMASLFTGTVEEYATLAAFPLVGVADTIYIALDTNVIYRYDTSLSAYVILSPNIINSLVFSDANGFDGTITLVGSVATLSITTALTLGSVPFIGASGALTQDNANLFFDDTNNRLGINTNAPTTALDVFGSGIIGRLNATSTNNAYLGFASNGTNKWSAGNVQSDHRFRIFSEANSAELITILQTGEFGIGIANPLTKLHIDGGATALIANLDANVSVAKSISYRSDNSSRINLEVSGTESGSNAGADFFIRRYSDAGALIDTPLTITRSTGVVSLASALPISSGGTGSATQNFVDLTTTQSIGGAKTFTSTLNGTTAILSTNYTGGTTGMLHLTSSGTEGGAITLEKTSGTAQKYKIGCNSTNQLFIYNETAANQPFTITSGGLVGIGSFFGSAPNFILDVKQATNQHFYIGAGIAVSGAIVLGAGNDAANANIPIEMRYSTTFAFVDGGTERMRIVSGGNVGIGNTTAIHKVQIGSNADQNTSIGKSILYLSGNAGNIGYVNEIGFGDVSETNPQSAIGNIITNATASSYGDLYFATRNVTTNTAPTERMRITSGGAVQLSKGQLEFTGGNGGVEMGTVVSLIKYDNTATILYFGTGDFILKNNSGAVGDIAFFYQSGTVRFAKYTSNGTLTTTSSNGTIAVSSDKNMKIDAGFVENGLEKVLSLKPRYFYWKDEEKFGNKKQLGFYAQEINEISEEASNTPEEGQGWGIYDRSLIAILTKAMQEQQAQIEELKSEINLLKIK